MAKTIKEITRSYNESRSRFAAEAKTALAEVFQTALQTPGVEGIRFRAYTDYFNDGDTCTFSVHEPTFLFTGQDAYLESYDLTTWNSELKRSEPIPELEQYVTVFENFPLNEFPEEMIKDIFGDHVEVTATLDENGKVQLDIEAYTDHD